MAKATEIEWLKWFAQNADFGPADGDVKDAYREAFVRETGNGLPEGWDYYSDGETKVPDTLPKAARRG